MPAHSGSTRCEDPGSDRAATVGAKRHSRWQTADSGERKRVAIGSVILEVPAQPHTGCAKFSARFGTEALKFVNSPEGKHLHLRGLNTKVIQSGTLQVGDVVKKL